MNTILRALPVLALLAAGCGDTAPAPGEAATLPDPGVAGPAHTGLKAFTGARIWDGTGAPVIENGIVVVRNGVIDAVGPAATVQVPQEAEVIDVGGRWLLPGLINSHGHVGGTRESMLAQLEQYAYYGITTVVSLGGNEAAGFPLRDEQWSPELEGRSRLFLAGPVISPSTPAEARSEVARVAEMDADWVKIRVDGGITGGGNKMSPQVYRTVIEEARERGLPVAIHIWELEDAKGVVEAGGALVAHSVRDRPVDQELIGLMLERDVCLVPTLTRELSTFVYADRPDFFDDPFFLERAAPESLDAFLTPNLRQNQATSAGAQHWRQQLPLAQENMRQLHEAGVGVAMGTDSGAPTGRWEGYFEHVEMEMMAEAGFTPEEILLAATGGAARCLDLDGVVGTVEAGNWADFLVLDENPLDDIRNTRTIHSVWTSGNPVR